MTDTNKLKELIKKQCKLAEEIERCSAEISGGELAIEVARLKEENVRLDGECRRLKTEKERLDGENKQLNNALENQILTARGHYLNASKNRMRLYFSSVAGSDCTELEALERQVKNQFEQNRAALMRYGSEKKTEYENKINALQHEINTETMHIRQIRAAQCNTANSNHYDAVNGIGNRDINFDFAKAEAKKPKIEHFIGLNLLGKIGAVLLIIGFVFLGQFVYNFFEDVGRSVFLFCVAGVVLAFALFINRKKRTILRVTILAVGVALMYAALTISYFVIGVLNVYAALAVCVVITAAVYAISVSIKTETVAVFAQIGGYLPIFAVVNRIEMLYVAMGYFLILSVLSFLLSSKFKWKILSFTALGLSLFGMIVVAVNVGIMYHEESFGIAQSVTLSYLALTFGLYILLPVITNIRKAKRIFELTDFVFMAVNTGASLVLLHIMFFVFGIGQFAGLLSFGFAIVFIGLYFLVRNFFKGDKNVQLLFWLSAAALLALFVPMQFDAAWFAFGWVLQGGILIMYGILKERKVSLYAGLIIAALSLMSYLIVDVVLGLNYVRGINVFVFKYAVMTLVSIVILGAIWYKHKKFAGIIAGGIDVGQIYTTAVYINAAGFLMYLSYFLFGLTSVSLNGITLYLLMAVMIGILFIFSTIVPLFFKKVNSLQITSIFVASIGILWLFGLNVFRLPAFASGGGTAERITSTIVIIFVSAPAMYAFWDAVRKITKYGGESLRPAIIISTLVYVCLSVTAILLAQYRLHFAHVTYSIIYVTASLIGITYGLWKNCTAARRFAIGLAVFAILKLFVIDTWQLGLLLRVVGYFAVGVLLIGMSFAYQVFYKQVANRSNSLVGDNDELIGKGE